MIRRAFCSVLLLALALPVAEAGSEFVSLVQLIAVPERHDGKLVYVTGYLSLQDEDAALYLTREDYRHRLVKNAVWVHASSEMLEERDSLHGKYVNIEAWFDASDRGHLDLFSGALGRVQRFSTAFNRPRD